MSPQPSPVTRRLAALAAVLALVAAACGGGDDSPEIVLGDDPGGPAATSDVPSALPGPTSTDDVFVTEFQDFNGGVTSLGAAGAGKPVVLNFFASWCPNCVAEMPDFEVVNQQRGTEVQLVGLATQDAPTDALALVDRTGVTYPLGLDPNGEFFQVFEGLGMPTTVFLTAEGEVAHTFTGQLSTEALSDKIDEFLL